MDWLTFSSKIIGSVAWPVVAAIAIFLFRNALNNLIGRIKAFDGFGFKIACDAIDSKVVELEKKGDAITERISKADDKAEVIQLSQELSEIAKESARLQIEREKLTSSAPIFPADRGLPWPVAQDLRNIVNNVIRRENLAVLSDQQLAEKFPEMISEIDQMKYRWLNSHSTTNLKVHGILDDKGELTKVGLKHIREFAKQ